MALGRYAGHMLLMSRDKKGFLWLPDLTIIVSIVLIGMLSFGMGEDLLRDTGLQMIMGSILALAILRCLWLVRWFHRDGNALHCSSVFRRIVLKADDCIIEEGYASVFSFVLQMMSTGFPLLTDGAHFLRLKERATGRTVFIGYDAMLLDVERTMTMVHDAVGVPVNAELLQKANRWNKNNSIALAIVGVVFVCCVVAVWLFLKREAAIA